MDVNGVTDHVEAVALAYCTDHPARLTATLPRLKISMKSFLKGAPEFPPPPKIWLITTCEVDSGVGTGLGPGLDDGLGEGDGDGVGATPPSSSVTGLL